MSARPDGYIGAESDPIHPVRVRHEVDEIWDEGRLEQWYNFFVYEFEQDGLRAWARAYADDIATVSLFGPFRGEGSLDVVAAPAFVEAIVGYLKRRFHRIDRLGHNDRDPGYKTIWERSPPG